MFKLSLYPPHCMRMFLWLALLLPSLAVSQSRPPLPADYYEKFQVQLPAGLQPTDSVGVARALQTVADAVEKLEGEAQTRYRISDTTQLASSYTMRALAALVQNRFTDYHRYRRMAMRLQPSPIYIIPPTLVPMAWSVAKQRVPDEASAAFRPALRLALRQQLDSLPALTRLDLLNSQKGAYLPAMTTLVRGELRKILSVAATRGNKLTYSAAAGFMRMGFSGPFYQRHRALVEQLLYELDPARLVDEEVQIPMRDGVQLHGLVYRNGAASGRVPVIVSLSPYPGGSEATQGNVFATNGYVYVYVDTRGRRKSGGSFFPYEQDAQDLYDIIDWASKQPWSDGQVATMGGSYLGFAQWQAIRQEYRHPALKAINPMVAVGFGVDFPRESNMFYSYILQWATYVSGRELNSAVFNDAPFWNGAFWQLYKNRLPFVKLDSVAKLPNPFFQKWVSHPDFDAYWQGILPKPADYAALDLPVLTITGYYDADQNGALYYYRQYMQHATAVNRSKHQLLIGPYDHGGAQWAPRAAQAGLPIERAAQVPVYRQMLQWFDWVLKKQAKPAWMLDQVTYFETNAGRWRGASSLQALTKDTLRLYLTPQKQPNPKRAGLLAMQTSVPKKTQSISYTHDVAQVLDSAFVFATPRPYDDSLYMTSAHNLVFESGPLPRAVTVSGALLPRLFLSLNVPDADFRVTVYEQTADGRSMQLATSGLRTRYRRSATNPTLMKPGKIERLDFNNNFLYVKKLDAGSRLRLVLEVQNTPMYERNFGFGGVVAQERATGPRPIETTVYTGRKYPSRVDVPVGE